MALTKWVANLVPTKKKQGSIRIFTEFWDQNLASPKDNYNIPFINQIINELMGNDLLSFMDVFSSYN